MCVRRWVCVWISAAPLCQASDRPPVLQGAMSASRRPLPLPLRLRGSVAAAMRSHPVPTTRAPAHSHPVPTTSAAAHSDADERSTPKSYSSPCEAPRMQICGCYSDQKCAKQRAALEALVASGRFKAEVFFRRFRQEMSASADV